ncbi:SEC-C metal-binding domain-containing protein [Bradyrhizobium sp. USDA 4463]
MASEKPLFVAGIEQPKSVADRRVFLRPRPSSLRSSELSAPTMPCDVIRTDALIQAAPSKIGRNGRCPCGSGLKYKTGRPPRRQRVGEVERDFPDIY